MIEKILERLTNEVLESSSAQAEAVIGMLGASANFYSGEKSAYEKAIEIVQEVAKEYGNGWIPCSERLPSEEETDDCATFLVTKRVRNKFTIIDLCLFGTEGEWLVRENEEVLAWQRIAPYQKGE